MATQAFGRMAEFPFFAAFENRRMSGSTLFQMARGAHLQIVKPVAEGS